ncbi:hypothetical protein HK096_003359 [Nowakowskiella sp. JEL0078]|nr:hypothetical protein HK096_003359 [Nowakowskiella sp. JEL0078]
MSRQNQPRSNQNVSEYPSPPAQSRPSRRDKQHRSAMFSIYFDSQNESPSDSFNQSKRTTMMNRMSMKIAPTYQEALDGYPSFSQVNEKKLGAMSPSSYVLEDGTLEFGNGTTALQSLVPFWRQGRQLAYLLVFITSVTALSLQSNINLRFGGKIIQNGKWNSLLIHSNWFVSANIFTSVYAMGMMIWYYFKKPSLAKTPYTFLASGTLWLVILDMSLVLLAFAFVFSMTLDVGIRFKSCYATAIRFAFSDKSACVMIQWAVGIAAVSGFMLAVVLVLRLMELRRIGYLNFGKRSR